jgi:hypothetical protein
VGAFGVFIYFGQLAYEAFKDSLFFPFALSGIGLIIMYMGLLYNKHIQWIEQKTWAIIPRGMRITRND